MMRMTAFRGASLAWMTPLACEAAALLRSLVLARMLGAEEMGRLMMLALLLRLAEMAGDLSIERLITQAPDGGSDRFLAVMHGAALIRGGALAILMLASAAPAAILLTSGPAFESYALLALVPMIRGTMNLDYRRQERDRSYRGMLVVEGGAALGMLIVAPLAAAALGDHRAFLPVALAHATCQVALSHGVARLRWRVAVDPVILRRVVRFGLPLLGNAILMFAVFHADRMIVAGFYDWQEVGRYAIALQLALLPAQIAGRAAASLLGPRFRDAIATGRIEGATAAATRAYLVLGAAFLAVYTLAAGPVIRLAYGADFSVEPALLLALGVASAIRIARTPLSQRAVAAGATAIPGQANLFRAAGLPVAVAIAAVGAPLWAVAAAGAVGEGLAAWHAARLVRGLGQRSGSEFRMEALA